MSKEIQLIYRLIEYGMEKEIIVKRALFADLNLSDIDQAYFESVLKSDAIGNLTPNQVYIIYSTSNSNNHLDYQYRLTPTAMFHYNDYMELKEARSNAVSAKKFSTWALIISIGSLLVSAFEALFH